MNISRLSKIKQAIESGRYGNEYDPSVIDRVADRIIGDMGADFVLVEQTLIEAESFTFRCESCKSETRHSVVANDSNNASKPAGILSRLLRMIK